MKSLSLASFAALVTTVLADSRTSAPSGCITAGSGGTYSTIQAAVDSLSTTSTTAQCIFIEAGTYNEQVVVSSREAQLTFYGYTSDTTSYSSNTVTITNNLSAADGLSDDETGTLRVQAANFKAYNINIANTYGKGSQAIALSAYADSGYYACQITGYQDTVLAETGYQLYAKSYIEGATDFIFGQYSPAWFNECDIGVLAASEGTITGESGEVGIDMSNSLLMANFRTANGRVSSSGTSYYVFVSSTLPCSELACALNGKHEDDLQARHLWLAKVILTRRLYRIRALLPQHLGRPSLMVRTTSADPGPSTPEWYFSTQP